MSETPETTTETRILVSKGHNVFTRWLDKPFETVVDEIVERVRDGKASSEGMEVIEVSIVRRVLVKPRIEAVDVTR